MKGTASLPFSPPEPAAEGLASSRPERVPKVTLWLRNVQWIIVIALAAQIGGRTIPAAWRTLNTDFPNYYLTARLVREHYDTSRIYEWIWFERQKDHRDIDQRIVGMVPITPFSTLAVYPVTSLPPLKAKHYWLIANIALLFATLFLLRALTQLPMRRIALVAALSAPLRVNFMYGQYYVLLLFLLTFACWLFVRRRSFTAGVVIGLAAGLKIFPIIYVVYFLRKRDLKAFLGGAAGTLGAVMSSVFVFGWEVHRTYFLQVLPATMRGEGLDPYNLRAASLSSLLHRLFIYEPQLNQHPALNAPWMMAISHPLLQMALIAPILLLSVPKESSSSQIGREWAAILLATVAMSTSASSYLLTILILPVCLLLRDLQILRRHLSMGILVTVFVVAGLLSGTNEGHEGWSAILAVPRLYALMLLCGFATAVLLRKQPMKRSADGRASWAAALTALTLLSMASNLRHLHGLYDDYRWRLPIPQDVYMAAHPTSQGDSILFVAMMPDGYHSVSQTLDRSIPSDSSASDRLAVTAANGEVWEEQTGHKSTITSTKAGRPEVEEAEAPLASWDGGRLAFLREDRGRARIWIRTLDGKDNADRSVTPPELNVLEMSFLPGGGMIFAASSDSGPALYGLDRDGRTRPLGITGARYPAVSPDGRRLVYSALNGGSWNLWLRNLGTGKTERLTQAACNSMQPSWTADSQTLLYASDCGRASWFTAICRRRVQ